MIKGLKKIALIGSLMLAGGVYSGGNFNYSNKGEEDYNEKLSNFLGKQSELYIALDAEKALKAEKEWLSKPLYLTPELLNHYIKKAYKEVGKSPKEIDKRLFRLMLKQESRYDAHAINKYSRCMGLGQIGLETAATLRPEKYERFLNSNMTPKDSVELERLILDPVENLGLSLEYLDYIAKFCEKNDKNWETKTLEEKRRTILNSYNVGHGAMQNFGFNPDNEKLPNETKKYDDGIMQAYHDPNVIVKL